MAGCTRSGTDPRREHPRTSRSRRRRPLHRSDNPLGRPKDRERNGPPGRSHSAWHRRTERTPVEWSLRTMRTPGPSCGRRSRPCQNNRTPGPPLVPKRYHAGTAGHLAASEALRSGRLATSRTGASVEPTSDRPASKPVTRSRSVTTSSRSAVEGRSVLPRSLAAGSVPATRLPQPRAQTTAIQPTIPAVRTVEGATVARYAAATTRATRRPRSPRRRPSGRDGFKIVSGLAQRLVPSSCHAGVHGERS